jgi:hypothetical protein
LLACKSTFDAKDESIVASNSLTYARLLSPVDQYFYWPGTGVCINELYADTILAAFNTFSELIVAILPIPIVFRMKMSTVQRWSILSLISLGFLVAIVGFVRTYYVWLLFASNDLTWWSGPHWICSEVEISLAMVRNILYPMSNVLYGQCINSVQICACAPALRPLVGRVFSGERPVAKELARSFLSKGRHPTVSSVSTYSPYATSTDTKFHHSFDLEGIAVDGYGYVVTITAGNGEMQRQKSKRYWPFGRSDIEDSVLSGGRWPFHRRGNSIDEKMAMEIVTTRSLELHESIYEARDYKSYRS